MPDNETLRSLLSINNPDIETIEKMFLKWSTYEEFMVFRKTHKHTGEIKHEASKMSKRGRQLVDGRGIERIISEIPSEVWL